MDCLENRGAEMVRGAAQGNGAPDLDQTRVEHIEQRRVFDGEKAREPGIVRVVDGESRLETGDLRRQAGEPGNGEAQLTGIRDVLGIVDDREASPRKGQGN